MLITGCRWQDLPCEYEAPTAVWRRLKRWGEAGAWGRIWRAALSALDERGQLDWSMSFLDSSFAPAEHGGEKVGATKRGKDAKWMLMADRGCDKSRVPCCAASSQHRDAHRAEATPGNMEKSGEPSADAQSWRAKKTTEDDRQRYNVERSFAWLDNFLRLLIRWERLFSVYRSRFAFAVMLLCVRRATTLACPISLGDRHARAMDAGWTRHERSTTWERERLNVFMAAPAS